MFKNIASQTLTLYAFDASTGLPKTGDAANMVFYVSKDDGTVTAIASNSGVPTEVDSTNGKGLYKIALSQAETNADKLLFSGKSSTSNIVVLPSVIYTLPPEWMERLRRAQDLLIQEWRDGCLECKDDDLCIEHSRKVLEMATNPRECPELQELLKMP